MDVHRNKIVTFKPNQFNVSNRSLILLLSFFTIVSSWAQEQISNIENVTNGYSQSSWGFVLYEGKEYFIERKEEATSVFLLEEDEASHLHDIYARPQDGKAHQTTDYRYSNSGVLVNNDMIYEIYDFNLYVLNFTTGDILANIELCENNIRYSGYFSFFRDLVLFKGEKSDGEYYFVYDLESEELLELTWTKDAQILPADQWIYLIDPNNSTVTGYNIETKSFDFEMEV